MLNAIGTSLVAVTAFGLTTAINYARSGLVAWGLPIGGWAARRLAYHRGALIKVFAALIFVVAAYVLWRSARDLDRPTEPSSSTSSVIIVSLLTVRTA